MRTIRSRSEPGSYGVVRRTVLRGASWSLLANLTPALTAIILTPYLIRGLGADRYGLFVIAVTVAAFVQSFDGGIGNSATRYFALISSGSEVHTRATSRLVFTLLAAVSIIGVTLSTILYVSSPLVVGFFDSGVVPSSEVVYLLRSLCVVVVLAQFRSVFTALLAAHQRYAWIGVTSVLSYLVYPIGYIWTIESGLGLRGIAMTLAGQSVVALCLVAPGTRKLQRIRNIRLMAKTEIIEFFRYSGTVQLSSIAGFFGAAADPIVIGRLVSVASVALYAPGASFAQQMRSVPMNALGAISVALSKEVGSGDRPALRRLFNSLQRNWVSGCTGWCAVGVGAAYFGVTKWLGPGFEIAGVIATLLLAAHLVNLWTGPTSCLLNADGRPELELRYAVISTVLNLALTVPFVYAFGILGTVVATSAGTIAGSLYLLRLTKKRYDDSVRSFLLDVPLAAGAGTIIFVAVLQLIASPLIPEGPLGLLTSGIVASPGLVLFYLLMKAETKVRPRMVAGAESSADSLSDGAADSATVVSEANDSRGK